jgi:hypothetical protein
MVLYYGDLVNSFGSKRLRYVLSEGAVVILFAILTLPLLLYYRDRNPYILWGLWGEVLFLFSVQLVAVYLNVRKYPL